MQQRSKILRSATIISDALYVDRDADRQLDGIIDEMGRPGYVLVARQMGKTNLLLRMKRRREAIGDLVLYYDLSIQFKSAQDLFRNVIDGLIERLDDESVRVKVEKDRTDLSLDANAEYDRHLRLAVSSTSFDKVIIVLDEIDSLVGHDYSDRILAQIRSMYFARANYSVYDRVTYVLSGVAEPTDLIKDKNISPFNIGEKIYLSDFSLAEVAHLARKAELGFEADVVEAVYGWAAGNPRMTWDILSALEDAGRAGEFPTPATVDAIVERLYLTRHDRPPIDHIRALAEVDRGVRASLITLLYGKGATLDDSARSRLYLAGITSASANEAPKIKNRIIESALSEVWLTQVEAKMSGVGNTASNAYREGNFGQAIKLFNQLVETSGGLSSLSDLQLLEFGLAQYKMYRLDEAAITLEAASQKTKSKDLRNTIKFYIASIHLRHKNPVAAIELFDDVVKFNGTFRLQAKHAVSSAYLMKDLDEHASDIITICNQVILEAEEDQELSDSDISELKAASHYNLSQAYSAIGRDDKAQESLSEAVRAIEEERFSGLASMVIRSMSDRETKRDTLETAARLVTEHRPVLEVSSGGFEFTIESLIRLLDAAVELRENSIFDGLLEFGLSTGDGPRFERALLLARTQVDSSRSRAGRNAILKAAFASADIFSTSSAKARLDAARAWLEVSDEPENGLAFLHFTREVGDNIDYLDEKDLLVLINRFSTLIKTSRDDDAWKLIAFVRLHELYFRERYRPIFVLYIQHEMAFYKSTGNLSREKDVAREIIRLTSSGFSRSSGSMSQYDVLALKIRGLAQAALQARPVRPHSNIGRNDLVSVRDRATGLQSSAKFKKVGDRIASGELELIGKVNVDSMRFGSDPNDRMKNHT